MMVAGFACSVLFSESADDALQQLEAKLNLSVPIDWRSFLHNTNGVVFDDDAYFFLPDHFMDRCEKLVVLFGMSNQRFANAVSFELRAREFYARVPQDLLPIGRTAGQDVLAMSCRKHDFGTVFLWRPVLEWESVPTPTEDELVLIASGFSKFLNMLMKTCE